MTSAQRWDAKTYAAHGAFVPALGTPVLDLLDPQPHELILDLGCGDGELTRRISERGARVRGIDASPELVAAAQARGVSARVLDAYELDEQSEYDAIFSNATLHWLREPGRVLTRIERALRAGGRFVGEFGGAGNTRWLHAQLIHSLDARNACGEDNDPWFFPSAEEYAALLRSAGFTDVQTELVPRPTRLPGDLLDWLSTFAQSFTSALSAEQRGEYLEEVRSAVKDRYCENGVWTLDYVRLRFSARKP